MKSLLIVPYDNGFAVTVNYEEQRDPESNKLVRPERKEKKVFEDQMDMAAFIGTKLGFPVEELNETIGDPDIFHVRSIKYIGSPE